jgi:FtsZ-binding cell division protein ZapB
MGEQWYKPCDADAIKNYPINKYHSTLEELWEQANLKHYQCLTFKNYAIVKNEIEQIISQVGVKTQEKKKKDKKVEAFPKELQETIKRLIEKYEFTQLEINQLKKQLKGKEFEKSDLEQQISALERKAAVLSNERNRKKVKRKFLKTYENFFEFLNPDLKDLDAETKKEFKDLLQKMSSIIADTLPYLDTN